MELLPQEDRQLRLDVLKEALVREVQSRVLKQLRQERILDSHEGGLVANPSAYREGPLSYLTNEAIRDLMKQGVAVQHGFLGEEMRKKILKEVELIEYDGRFNEVFHQTVHDVRKDYMCWMSTNDLDRETQQGLWQLFKAMQALPFELNKKANLCLQMSWVFQLAVYQGDGAYYRKHMDGGYEASVDNGRKISALYYPNATDWQEKDGGYLRVYPRRRREQQLAEGSAMGADEEEKKEDEEGKDENVKKRTVDIKPAGDTLVLLRSRDMPHEVLPTYRKRFAVTLWITGPPGPGDDT
ncbi:hypoxia- inducible factor prolyl hydroxylase [Cystoisospora suis]|uniref:Hypoxia-inducible factor prolyl hydroxylase n=1 Tax=Cystoisospora suis TaxID=483139 RepID=A0A2C6L462_9APIC|nr:hypoxia- inducible factor prolyl hydroxylase [Cystoisospora suis]